MVSVTWVNLGSPGSLYRARASADGVVVTDTLSDDTYLVRRTATALTWERIGLPPGATSVLAITPLGVDASSTVTVAVLTDGLQAWLYQLPGASQPWTSLDAPPGPVTAFWGTIAGITTIQDGTAQHTLAVTDAGGRAWIRQGTGPAVTWAPIVVDPSLQVAAVRLAMASVLPWTNPQLHMFVDAVPHAGGTGVLRVGMSDNGTWSWYDPGALDSRPRGRELFSAVSFLDTSGQLRAALLTQAHISSDVSLEVLTGSGDDWTWTGLGNPPSSDHTDTPILAGPGPGPQAGTETLVAVGVADHLWTWSVASGWTDRGACPDGEVYLAAASTQAGTGTGLRASAFSKEGNLWTFTLDASGSSWTSHGCPDTVTTLVGAYSNPVEGANAFDELQIFAIDQHGELWQVPSDHAGGWDGWASHGLPSAGVTCVGPVGAFRPDSSSSPPPDDPAWVFTKGSDGHLWARSASAGAWTWVDHGSPAGRAVTSGTDPLPVATPPGGVAVHVLADDGRLWMRAGASADPGPGPDWTWTDRGVPPGELIFAIVGAAAVPPSSLVAVITGDGHVWASVPAGSGFSWTDLGSPLENIVAGIGLATPTGDPGKIEIAALGVSGQIWTALWWPGTSAGQWTPRGRPGDAPIRAALGVTPDPVSGALVKVIGSDQHVWELSTASATSTWSRWEPGPSNSLPANVTSGRAVALPGNSPSCAVLVTEDKRAVRAHG
jgi:hypothetical protein